MSDDGGARSRSLAHQVPHVEAGMRVQAGARLVQERDLGTTDEGGGERHPLSLAAGEPADGRAGERPDAQPLDQVVDGGRARRTAGRGGAAAGPVACRWAGRRPAASPRPGPGGRRRRATGRAQHADRPAVGAPQPLAALDRWWSCRRRSGRGRQ